MSRLLDGIPIKELTEDHLNSLKQERVAESVRLEFKAELKMASDSEKRELCKDVSAMANSQGGYILFGVSEANGVVSGIPGITFTDTEQQQFMQIITSGIAPRLQH
ncbi:ATP-binding protein [Candidatus Sumerlaeota bacterium]|nr:ATP-binding protein [Candidatus Sumerlaeota bacterium]